MALTKLKSLQGLKRRNKLQRLDTVLTNTSGTDLETLRDLLETDQFTDLKINDEERLELELDLWNILSSSNVKAIKLTNKGKTLLVKFGDNSIYEWSTNAQGYYNALLSAASAGRYIQQVMYGTHSKKIS